MKYGELVKVSKIIDIGDIIETNDKLSLKDQIETNKIKNNNSCIYFKKTHRDFEHLQSSSGIICISNVSKNTLIVKIS